MQVTETGHREQNRSSQIGISDVKQAQAIFMTDLASLQADFDMTDLQSNHKAYRQPMLNADNDPGQLIVRTEMTTQALDTSEYVAEGFRDGCTATESSIRKQLGSTHTRDPGILREMDVGQTPSSTNLNRTEMTRRWVEKNGVDVLTVPCASLDVGDDILDPYQSQSDSEEELLSWQSNSELQTPPLPDDHPLAKSRESLTRHKVVSFIAHTSGHDQNSTGPAKGSTMSSDRQESTSDQSGAKKRKASERSSGEKSAPKVHRRRISSSSDENDEKLLACPFCKNDARRYRDCYKYILRDISRLKQHLARRHRIPIHCPSCSLEFDLEEERDDHIRSRSCEVLPQRDWDGINETQKKLLERRINAKKSREENWYVIYEILFPGSPRPKSPYVDAHLSEELLTLREYTTTEGPSIIADFTRSRLPKILRPQHHEIQAFLETIFPEPVGLLLEHYATSRPSEPADANIERPLTAPPRSSDSGLGSTEIELISSGNDAAPEAVDNSRGGVGEEQLSDTQAFDINDGITRMVSIPHTLHLEEPVLATGSDIMQIDPYLFLAPFDDFEGIDL